MISPDLCSCNLYCNKHNNDIIRSMMLQWSWIAYSWSSHRPLGVRTCLGLLVEFTVYADGFQYGRWLRILGDLLDWTILSLLLYCFLPIDPVPAAVMVVTRSCNAREYRKHQVLSDLNPVIDCFRHAEVIPSSTLMESTCILFGLHLRFCIFYANAVPTWLHSSRNAKPPKILPAWFDLDLGIMYFPKI
jgi:hypothetical protein